MHPDFAAAVRRFIARTLESEKLPVDDRAVEILLMIAAHESAKFRHVRQIHGPALSLFQIEPICYNEVKRYLDVKFSDETPDVSVQRSTYEKIRNSDFADLLIDQGLATVIARTYLLRIPEPLPAVSFPINMALYAKKHWNTDAGRADHDDYYNAYMSYKTPVS